MHKIKREGKMDVILYMHGGSDNRGNEAILRCTKRIITPYVDANRIKLFSLHPEEDTDVSLDNEFQIIQSPQRSIPEIPKIFRAVAKIYRTIFHSEKLYYFFTDYPFHKYDFRQTIAISTGGDAYCYRGGE